MQAGSTGLGDKTLKFRIKPPATKREGMPSTYPTEGKFIIMGCKTYDPVVWNIWVGIERSDFFPLLRLIFTREVLGCLLKWLFMRKPQ
jgi:hypothetical protein